MKKYWKRGAFALVAVVLAIVLATPAMAIISTGRSEEMVFQSNCDKAGTLELKFTEDDVKIIAEYLSPVNTPKLNETLYGEEGPDGILGTDDDRVGTAAWVLVEVSLGSLNITSQVSPPPTLCKPITSVEGDNTDPCYRGADGITCVPDGAVPLYVIGYDVSRITQNEWTTDPVSGDPIAPADKCDTDTSDVTAYVYGTVEDNEFTIYITDISNNDVLAGSAWDDFPWDDQNRWPWIKVGLDEIEYPEEITCKEDGHQTTICVDVSGYSDEDDLATLNVSMDITPENLTYTTSDSQIGHFDDMGFAVMPCVTDKNNVGGCVEEDSDYVPLCELGEQADCETYYLCQYITNLSQPDTYKFVIRSADGTDAYEDGVFLADVTLRQENAAGVMVPLGHYLPGDDEDMQRLATFYALVSGSYGDRVGDTDCTFLAQYYQTVIPEEEIDFTDVIQICIAYQVNTDPNEPMPTVGELAAFSVEVRTANFCETSIGTEFFDGAEFVECGQLEHCMYFPYVLIDHAPWATGIVVTSLSEDVPFEQMDVAIQLFDRNGTKYVGALPDSVVLGKTFSFQLDEVIGELGWEVPSGPGWLWVTGNFKIDGYSFLMDGTFGGSSLPRILEDCEDVMTMR